MRRPLSILASAALLGLAAAGCGDADEGTPVACQEGTGAYLRALDDAPGEVRLKGEPPISDCLSQNQGGGELAAVGAAMVTAATRLNAEARADPGGAAGLRLGYLVGGATRGAERTEGIHADLIRRLSAAARYSPGDRTLPAAFRRAYRRGYDAGFSRG